MPSYDRPYSEGQRDRDRGYREREFPSGRRGHDRRDDDDDRGPWISRDRDDYERGGFRGRDWGDESGERRGSDPDFDPRRSEFRERRRFEQFEDWERPREFSGHPSSGRSFGGHGGGYSGFGTGSTGFGYGGASRGSSFGRGRSGRPVFGGGQYGGQFGQTPYEPQGRYAGRGPKGYRRSDERIMEEICEVLTIDPDIDAVEIAVTVQSGEVTLEGTVPERSMKRAAEDRAEGVSGVQQVHNRLRVESNNDFGRGAGGPAGSSGRNKGDEGQRSGAERKAH